MKKYLILLFSCLILLLVCLLACDNKTSDQEPDNPPKQEPIKDNPISETTKTNLTEEDFINWYVTYMKLQDKYPREEDKIKFDEEYNKLYSDNKYSKESFLAFQENIRQKDPERWLKILEKVKEKLIK